MKWHHLLHEFDVFHQANQEIREQLNRRNCAQTPGFVSRTIFSQKSTPTRLSWKILWSNMYSAASPRLTIHSAIGGGLIPNAMFWAYVAHVAWLSPQIPQIRLVMKWASRGSFPFMKML